MRAKKQQDLLLNLIFFLPYIFGGGLLVGVILLLLIGGIDNTIFIFKISLTIMIFFFLSIFLKNAVKKNIENQKSK